MSKQEDSMEKWRALMTYRSSKGLSNHNGFYDEEKSYEYALYWSKYDWGGRELSPEDIKANRDSVFGRVQEGKDKKV